MQWSVLKGRWPMSSRKSNERRRTDVDVYDDACGLERSYRVVRGYEDSSQSVQSKVNSTAIIFGLKRKSQPTVQAALPFSQGSGLEATTAQPLPLPSASLYSIHRCVDHPTPPTPSSPPHVLRPLLSASSHTFRSLALLDQCPRHPCLPLSPCLPSPLRPRHPPAGVTGCTVTWTWV